MSSTIAKTWKIVKPHVPMIQFKKGGQSNEAPSKVASSSTKMGKGVMDSISESMLPKKYFRKPMDPIEIQAINYGGTQAL